MNHVSQREMNRLGLKSGHRAYMIKKLESIHTQLGTPLGENDSFSCSSGAVILSHPLTQFFFWELNSSITYTTGCVTRPHSEIPTTTKQHWGTGNQCDMRRKETAFVYFLCMSPRTPQKNCSFLLAKLSSRSRKFWML